MSGGSKVEVIDEIDESSGVKTELISLLLFVDYEWNSKGLTDR